MSLIEEAVELALTYKSYELGGRNSVCSPNDESKYRTALPEFKLRNLAELATAIQHIKGDVLEVGVWRGGVGLLLSILYPNKNIYLVDTFTGLPTITSEDTYHKLNDFDDTSFTEVTNMFEELKMDKVKVIKGLFPNDLRNRFSKKTFSFVHLDVDTYESYKHSLEFIYPRLAVRGILVLDDYREETCAGATKAVDEFLEKYKLKFEYFNLTYFLEKQ